MSLTRKWQAESGTSSKPLTEGKCLKKKRLKCELSAVQWARDELVSQYVHCVVSPSEQPRNLGEEFEDGEIAPATIQGLPKTYYRMNLMSPSWQI